MRNAMQQYGVVFICRYAMFMAYSGFSRRMKFRITVECLWHLELRELGKKLYTTFNLCYLPYSLQELFFIVLLSSYLSPVSLILSWSVVVSRRLLGG